MGSACVAHMVCGGRGVGIHARLGRTSGMESLLGTRTTANYDTGGAFGTHDVAPGHASVFGHLSRQLVSSLQASDQAYWLTQEIRETTEDEWRQMIRSMTVKHTTRVM